MAHARVPVVNDQARTKGRIDDDLVWCEVSAGSVLGLDECELFASASEACSESEYLEVWSGADVGAVELGVAGYDSASAERGDEFGPGFAVVAECYRARSPSRRRGCQPVSADSCERCSDWCGVGDLDDGERCVGDVEAAPRCVAGGTVSGFISLTNVVVTIKKINRIKTISIIGPMSIDASVSTGSS